MGLLLHPFKTIEIIKRERDPLQVLIIFGLPFYFWIGGVVSVIAGRMLLKVPFFQFGFLAKLALLIISLTAGIIFSYLAYWFFVWWRKRQKI